MKTTLEEMFLHVRINAIGNLKTVFHTQKSVLYDLENVRTAICPRSAYANSIFAADAFGYLVATKSIQSVDDADTINGAIIHALAAVAQLPPSDDRINVSNQLQEMQITARALIAKLKESSGVSIGADEAESAEPLRIFS